MNPQPRRSSGTVNRETNAGDLERIPRRTIGISSEIDFAGKKATIIHGYTCRVGGSRGLK